MINMNYLIVQSVIAIVGMLIIGYLHEWLHKYKAKKLGYDCKRIDARHNSIIIDIDDGDPNIEVIGRYPYKILIPVGIVLSIVGFWVSLGLMLIGIGTLLIHGAAWLREGEDVKEVFQEA